MKKKNTDQLQYIVDKILHKRERGKNLICKTGIRNPVALVNNCGTVSIQRTLLNIRLLIEMSVLQNNNNFSTHFLTALTHYFIFGGKLKVSVNPKPNLLVFGEKHGKKMSIVPKTHLNIPLSCGSRQRSISDI